MNLELDSIIIASYAINSDETNFYHFYLFPDQTSHDLENNPRRNLRSFFLTCCYPSGENAILEIVTLTDTHPEAERVLITLLRQAPVWRKMQMLGDLNRTANQLALEGLRDKYPHAAESELQRHLADLLLGPELAQKAYGPQPSQQEVKSRSK